MQSNTQAGLEKSLQANRVLLTQENMPTPDVDITTTEHWPRLERVDACSIVDRVTLVRQNTIIVYLMDIRSRLDELQGRRGDDT